MLNIARKLFGSSNDREIKRMRPIVDQINALEPDFVELDDAALAQKTVEFRERHENGESLDKLLPEAFAAVREAAKRALGQRHYDVQLMGGIVLHRGNIAEMRTGEGKTLVSTLAAYLNALPGKGVHVVTVNDYLAQRDSEWMGRVFAKLGMTTGVIIHGMSDPERRAAYGCDITYGTNNELGFDYLRDNMKYALNDMVQFGGRPLEKAEHHYAIVDEVDSILIDEARTPLIISGQTEDRTDFYKTIDAIIPLLDEEDYTIDEKARSCTFTEEGNEHIEQLLKERDLLDADADLYDIENISVVHHVNQGLKAHKLFVRDKDYIVREDKVVLIDEFTGRMMKGRRLSDGLHQAIEAKEGVEIQPENVTLASVTFQNYFRLYDKLAGMTGTASTEAEEFGNIYGLEVIEIPTNLPIQRLDEDDEVYRTVEEKYKAIVREIKEASAKGQPILVGTTAGLDAGFRRHICTLPGRRRHAHMVGVTPEMMRQAMRADWTEVHQLGERLARQLRGTRTLHVQSGPREHLTVRPDGRCRWHNGSGQLREPGFTNLPGGEVVTCPGDVEGSFRADGGVWIGDRVLGRGSALTLRFAAGELVEVNGPEADALWEATEGPNGRRVGQLSFGTNTSVLTPIGAMLQDLKMPGLHLVLGYSCPEQTGASWSSEVMVPVLCRRPDVSADGQPILVRGRYAQQLMA